MVTGTELLTFCLVIVAVMGYRTKSVSGLVSFPQVVLGISAL